MPCFDRLQEHQIDQLADGIRVGGVFDGFEVDRRVAAGTALEALERLIRRHFLHDVAERIGGGVVVLLDQLLEHLRIGDLARR